MFRDGQWLRDHLTEGHVPCLRKLPQELWGGSSSPMSPAGQAGHFRVIWDSQRRWGPPQASEHGGPMIALRGLPSPGPGLLACTSGSRLQGNSQASQAPAFYSNRLTLRITLVT